MLILQPSSRFILCTSLIVVLLLGNELVYGRHPLKRRQITNHTSWNYYNPSNYPNPQTNNNPNSQSGSGNRLYPVLDFTSPSQIDPGFAPQYHMRYNGTYIPNISWGNGNVNPNNRYPPVNNYPNNRYPPVNNYPNNRYPSVNNYPNNRYPPINNYPNNNYTNPNVRNPYDNQLPANLISENNIPIPRTTCGKTLCSYVPNYPTKEIGSAVDRARDALRSGNANALRSKGLSIQTFTSKRNIGANGSTGNRGINPSSPCRTNTNTIYPHEGFSNENSQAYFVVNVPGLDQTISSVECDSGNAQMCNQRNGPQMNGIKTCQQAYRQEKLLALPFGKNYLDVNDFELRTFHVPAGCYCTWSSRPY